MRTVGPRSAKPSASASSRKSGTVTSATCATKPTSTFVPTRPRPVPTRPPRRRRRPRLRRRPPRRHRSRRRRRPAADLTRPRLALVPGEPAGIGPELCVRAAQRAWDADLVAYGDRDSLQRAAEALRLPLRLASAEAASAPGVLPLIDVPNAVETAFGVPDARNAASVVAALRDAAAACIRGDCDGLVTGPVNKATINQGGIAYTGTTELLAMQSRCDVVMMLANDVVRVALATTHLRLRGDGMQLVGPLPADTAFLPSKLQGFDAILAMYHDQGLPVLKFSGFERAVNLTLGLPSPRVAVDHGTALDIAGSGRADPSSLFAAIDACTRLAATRRIRHERA